MRRHVNGALGEARQRLTSSLEDPGSRRVESVIGGATSTRSDLVPAQEARVLAVINKRWTEDAGRKTLDGRHWTEDAGRKTLDGRRWTEDAGRKTLDGRRWTEDAGRKTLDGRRWTEDVGRKTLDGRRSASLRLERTRRVGPAPKPVSALLDHPLPPQFPFRGLCPGIALRPFHAEDARESLAPRRGGRTWRDVPRRPLAGTRPHPGSRRGRAERTANARPVPGAGP
ncbi:Uncharacterized protein GBIM_01672 [Gryllus bimaculatus]|nr:Uncharacterized protein GBIM_01672 [Gryllus bimaculatus]